MEQKLISSAWADFSWKVIQHIECPIHRHNMTKTWENFAKKMQELSENERSAECTKYTTILSN